MVSLGLSAPVAIAACSLTTELNGLSSGAGASSAGDADATGARDGGGSDAPQPGADAGSFCAAQPAGLHLCADFDDGVFPPALRPQTLATGFAELVTDDVRSAPYAAALGTTPTSGQPGAALVGSFPTGQKRITVALDLKVDAYGGTSDWDIVNIGPEVPQFGLQLKTDHELAFDEDLTEPNAAGKTSVETRTGYRLPDGWVRVQWIIEVNGGAADTRLSVDGIEVVRQSFSASATKVLSATPFELGDRIQASLKTPWRVRMDNVTIDLR